MLFERPGVIFQVSFKVHQETKIRLIDLNFSSLVDLLLFLNGII